MKGGILVESLNRFGSITGCSQTIPLAKLSTYDLFAASLAVSGVLTLTILFDPMLSESLPTLSVVNVIVGLSVGLFWIVTKLVAPSPTRTLPCITQTFPVPSTNTPPVDCESNTTLASLYIVMSAPFMLMPRCDQSAPAGRNPKFNEPAIEPLRKFASLEYPPVLAIYSRSAVWRLIASISPFGSAMFLICCSPMSTYSIAGTV